VFHLRHLWHWLCLEVTRAHGTAGWMKTSNTELRQPDTVVASAASMSAGWPSPMYFPLNRRAYGVILRSYNISTHARSSAARTVVRYRMRYVKCSAIPNIAIKPLCVLRID